MRVTLRSLLTFIALGCASPMAHAADIYVLSNNSFSTGAATTSFGKVDSNTGQYTGISTLTGDVWNITWNPNANNFYVTEGEGTLRTLDLSGTMSASLGTIGLSIYGMAYRTADSTLYAYSMTGNRTGTLSPTGAFTVSNPATGLDVSSPRGGRYTIMNDTLYMTGDLVPNDVLGTFAYTANAPFVPIGSNNILYRNIVLANDGTSLYGIWSGTVGSQRLNTIDPGTGVLTSGPLISGSGFNRYFKGASTITAVPEPSTYALAAVASGVLAVIARRRKAKSKI